MMFEIPSEGLTFPAKERKQLEFSFKILFSGLASVRTRKTPHDSTNIQQQRLAVNIFVNTFPNLIWKATDHL